MKEKVPMWRRVRSRKGMRVLRFKCDCGHIVMGKDVCWVRGDKTVKRTGMICRTCKKFDVMKEPEL